MATANEPVAGTEAHPYGPPIEVVVSIRVTALAVRDAEGRYSVVVPELPGVVTAADSIEEVPAMVVEAAEGCMAVDHRRNRDRALASMTEPFPGEANP